MIIIQDVVLKGMMHSGYGVTPPVLDVLACLDGTTPREAIPSRVRERTGRIFPASAVEELIGRLEQFDLLETPTTRNRRAKLASEFAQMKVRPPCGALGAFYPANARNLNDTIEECFVNMADALHVTPQAGPASGLILPHGAIHASGRCAAHALHRFAQTSLPDLYVIIGPNHVYPGAPGGEVILHPFETPLGRVIVDKDAVLALVARANGTVRLEPIAHFRDHSIEMCLLFLQWIHSRSLEPRAREFRILPLLLTGARHHPGIEEPSDHCQVWQQIATAVGELVSSSTTRVTVVASGDFTHWGPMFDFLPFPKGDRDAFRAWDQPLLDGIESRSVEGLLAAWKPTNCCAGRPLCVVLPALGDQMWQLADYHVARSEGNAISFASYITGE